MRLGAGRVGPAVAFGVICNTVLGLGWAAVGLASSWNLSFLTSATVAASACIVVVLPVMGCALWLVKALVFAMGNRVLGGQAVTVEHFLRATAYVDALAPGSVMTIAAVTIGSQHGTMWPAAVLAGFFVLARIRLHARFGQGPPRLDVMLAWALASLPWTPLFAVMLLILVSSLR